MARKHNKNTDNQIRASDKKNIEPRKSEIYEVKIGPVMKVLGS